MKRFAYNWRWDNTMPPRWWSEWSCESSDSLDDYDTAERWADAARREIRREYLESLPTVAVQCPSCMTVWQAYGETVTEWGYTMRECKECRYAAVETY